MSTKDRIVVWLELSVFLAVVTTQLVPAGNKLLFALTLEGMLAALVAGIVIERLALARLAVKGICTLVAVAVLLALPAGAQTTRRFDRGFDRRFDHGSDRRFDHGSDRRFDHGSDRRFDHGSDRRFDRGFDRRFEVFLGNPRFFSREGVVFLGDPSLFSSEILFVRRGGRLFFFSVSSQSWSPYY